MSKAKTWLSRAAWVGTAVAAGLLVSAFMAIDSDQILLARTGRGGSMADRFEGGVMAVGGGLKDREILFFLDGRSGQMKVMQVNRARGRIEGTFEQDVFKDFQVSGRGVKPKFVMLLGDRYEGVMNAYLVETQTGQMVAYLLDTSRNQFRVAFRQQLTESGRKRLK